LSPQSIGRLLELLLSLQRLFTLQELLVLGNEPRLPQNFEMYIIHIGLMRIYFIFHGKIDGFWFRFSLKPMIEE
jgi:hypothetical protein